MRSTGAVLVGLGLAALTLPAVAGTRARRTAERAWLGHTCELGRLPADLRVDTGVLPPLPPGAQALDPRSLGPRVVVRATRDALVVDGITTSLDALPARVATARHRPGDADRPPRLVLLGAADLPASTWGPVWRALDRVRPGLSPGPSPDPSSGTTSAPVLIALERARPSPAPDPPDAQVAEQLRSARAAIRPTLEGFVRHAALDDLGERVGVPRGDCAVVQALFREPVRVATDCSDRVDDAMTSLGACDLSVDERARAATALGETWHPTDRAVLALVEVSELPTTADATLGQAVRGTLDRRPPDRGTGSGADPHFLR